MPALQFTLRGPHFAQLETLEFTRGCLGNLGQKFDPVRPLVTTDLLSDKIL